MKIVYIRWMDADTTTGWKSKDEVEEDKDSESTICTSVGFLIHQNQHTITICSGYHEDEYSEVTKIPKGMVREMTEVQLVEET
jgi:hypothetical protein